MLRTPLFIGKQRLMPMVASLTIGVLVLLTLADSALAATRTLMLNPTRLIFTDRQRTMDVHVVNPTQETITYSIATITMRKDAKGELREATNETEAERSIRNMIRYSPRRATIEPGKRQIIKLMVNKPSDLPQGEYQTRLQLSPQVDKQTNTGPGVKVQGGSMINLDIIVNSTFPIIIQHGGIAAEVAPVALAVKPMTESPSGMAAEVKFSRSGNASAFGNIRLHYVPANDPKAIREIGKMLGMAIYLPETERTMPIPLENISRQELASGTVRVSYQASTGSNNPREQSGQQSVKDFPLR